MLMRCAFVASALAAVASAASVDEALAADDACAAGAGCAFHALQTQRWEVDGSGAAERRPVPQHEALFQAMAKAGVHEKHLEQPRKEYAKLSAKELEARSNATSNSSCETWTGGSCLTSGCSSSRGATDCSGFRCMCKQGFCAKNGVCVFDMGAAASAWGSGSFGSWGAPAPAPAPFFGSWGAPAPAPAPFFGSWGVPAAPAPSPWTQSASAWSSAWQSPSSSGSSFTGGSCMTSKCDASRGPTDCGMTTGYQCMCKSGFRASNGVCIWR